MQLLGTGFQIAGKSAAVVTNSNVLAYSSWSSEIKGQDLETLNFTSYDVLADQSYGEGIIGSIEASVKFGGDWDAGDNSLTNNPPGLYPRDDLPDTQFFTNVNAAIFWQFPWIRLRSSHNGAEVKGKVTFDTSGMSQGLFIPPVGNQ